MTKNVKLPEGWKKVSLLEEITFIKGRAPKRLYDYEEKDTIKYLTPEYLRKNTQITSYCNINDTERVDNDVVVLWDGSNAGEVFFAKDGGLASTMVKIEIKDTAIKQFLYYYLKFYEPILKYQIRGSGIPHAEKDMFGLLPNIFPPLPEQQKIAEILETVDNAIEKTDRIIEKYKRIKQGLMQDLLTKGIVENYELGIRNYELRNEKRHKFKDSPLGRIPEEWEVVELGSVGKIITGSTPPTGNLEYYGDDYLFISPEDIADGKFINDSQKKLSELGFNISRAIPSNSVCVVCIGSTIGKVAITTNICTTNQQINSIIPNKNLFNPDALFYFVLFYSQNPLKQESGLQAVPIVNKSRFSKIKIPLPPLPEQKRIAKILSQIDETIEKEQKYKEKLERIKEGLMEDLLTGKVRVNEEL